MASRTSRHTKTPFTPAVARFCVFASIAFLSAGAESKWCQVETVKADVHGNYTYSGPWRIDGCTTLSLDHGKCAEADCPWRVKFGDEDILTLAGQLRDNKELTVLSIASNKISDEGAMALADGIRYNEILTELNLQGNEIGDRGAMALAEALSIHPALTLLNIEYNILTDGGGHALLEVLKSNSSALDTLRVKYNRVSKELVEETDLENRLALLPPEQQEQLRKEALPLGRDEL